MQDTGVSVDGHPLTPPENEYIPIGDSGYHASHHHEPEAIWVGVQPQQGEFLLPDQSNKFMSMGPWIVPVYEDDGSSADDGRVTVPEPDYYDNTQHPVSVVAYSPYNLDYMYPPQAEGKPEAEGHWGSG